MLDAVGRILQANSAARAILDRGDCVYRTADDRLRATFADDDRTLALAVDAALATEREGESVQRRIARVRSRVGPHLLVILDTIASGIEAAETADARLLLRMIDEGSGAHPRSYPLQAAFDLTAAEMRVAALIAQGLSPAHAAVRLAVSVNTVRTHLMRVFDKTGVRSQHALTLLLAASGSWPIA